MLETGWMNKMGPARFGIWWSVCLFAVLYICIKARWSKVRGIGNL